MDLNEIQQIITGAGDDVDEAIVHLDKGNGMLEAAAATVRAAGEATVHGEPDAAARAATGATTKADHAKGRALAAVREANDFAAWV